MKGTKAFLLQIISICAPDDIKHFASPQFYYRISAPVTFRVGNPWFCLAYKGALQWLQVYWSPLKCCGCCQLRVTDLHHGSTLWLKTRGNLSQGTPCSSREKREAPSTPLELPGVQRGPQLIPVWWARDTGAYARLSAILIQVLPQYSHATDASDSSWIFRDSKSNNKCGIWTDTWSHEQCFIRHLLITGLSYSLGGISIHLTFSISLGEGKQSLNLGFSKKTKHPDPKEIGCQICCRAFRSCFLNAYHIFSLPQTFCLVFTWNYVKPGKTGKKEQENWKGFLRLSSLIPHQAWSYPNGHTSA